MDLNLEDKSYTAYEIKNLIIGGAEFIFIIFLFDRIYQELVGWFAMVDPASPSGLPQCRPRFSSVQAFVYPVFPVKNQNIKKNIITIKIILLI